MHSSNFDGLCCDCAGRPDEFLVRDCLEAMAEQIHTGRDFESVDAAEPDRPHPAYSANCIRQLPLRICCVSANRRHSTLGKRPR